MATARMTLGSILETVSQTANSVSSLVNTTTKSIGMLDALVSKAATEQSIQHEIDKELFIDRLQEEVSFDRANANLKMAAFCSKSNAHKSLFENNYNRFGAILAKHRAKTETQDTL